MGKTKRRNRRRHYRRFQHRQWKRLDIDKYSAEELTFSFGDNDEHRISPIECSDGTWFGLLWCHPAPQEIVDAGIFDYDEATPQCGQRYPHCEAVLSFEGWNDHRLKRLDPPSIFPSLVCTLCLQHGSLVSGHYYRHRPHYTNGQWWA